MKMCLVFNLDAIEMQLRYNLSLSSPHPLWSSLDDNPHQAKAVLTQAVLLSGCLLQPCLGQNLFEDIEHIFLQSCGLTHKQRQLEDFTLNFVADKPVLQPIVFSYLLKTTDNYLRMQFLLDCSVLPLVITSFQAHGDIIHKQLFRISRTWCRGLHVGRMKSLGRYNKL